MFVCVFLYSRLCLCECVSVCDVVPNNMGSSWFQGVMSPITLDHVTVMWLAERLSLSPIIRRRNGSALSFTKILPHGACVEDSGTMSGHWPLLKTIYFTSDSNRAVGLTAESIRAFVGVTEVSDTVKVQHFELQRYTDIGN